MNCLLSCLPPTLPSLDSIPLDLSSPASILSTPATSPSFSELINTLDTEAELPLTVENSLHDSAATITDDTFSAPEVADMNDYLCAAMLQLPLIMHNAISTDRVHKEAPSNDSAVSVASYLPEKYSARQLQEHLQALIPSATVYISPFSRNDSGLVFHIAIDQVFSSSAAEATPVASTDGRAFITAFQTEAQPTPLQSCLTSHTPNLACQTPPLEIEQTPAKTSPPRVTLPYHASPLPDRQNSSRENSSVVGDPNSHRLFQMMPPLSPDSFTTNKLPFYTDGSERLRGVLRATITTLHHTNGTAARIILYPESLGTIVVHLQMQNTSAMVQITVTSPQTLSLIERTIELLRTDLQNAGIPAETIAVRFEDPAAQQQPSIAATAATVAPVGEDTPERRHRRRQQTYQQRYSHSSDVHFEHFM